MRCFPGYCLRDHNFDNFPANYRCGRANEGTQNMLREISKITSAVADAVTPTNNKKSRSKNKMVEHLDWRPEAEAKRTRNRKLSKLSR